jgi:hypothetical protein
MVKKLFLFFLLPTFFISFLESKILRYKYFAETQCMKGGSGKIYSMNSYTLEKNKLSFALHRFDMSFNYGATENAEVGLAFNLNELQNSSNFSEGIKKVSPFLKYHILNSSYESPFDLTIGFYQTNGIVVLEKLLPKIFVTSIATNLNFALDKQQKFSYTITLSKYTKWVEFIFDSDITNENYSFGTRYLLTPEIKLDLFVHDLKNITNILFDNFIFGITVKFDLF